MDYRRIVGTILWVVVVPLLGAARIGWVALRFAVWRPKTILLAGGLLFAFETSSAVTEPLVADTIRSHVTLVVPFGPLVFGLVALVLGSRTRASRRLRLLLRARGWAH